MASPRLLLACAAGLILVHPASAIDLWKFDIWNEPAPAPEDGPPFSAHASRDMSLLKWQVLGIAGAYVIFVSVTFALLLTVGKRLRRAAQTATVASSMEMVRTSRWASDGDKGGKSWGLFGRSKEPTRSKTPIVTQVATFDQDVIQTDKIKRELEMERLYAAVMDGDVPAPKEVLNKSQEWGRASDTDSLHTRGLSSPRSQRSFSQRIPPQTHARNASTEQNNTTSNAATAHSGDMYSTGPGPAAVDFQNAPPQYQAPPLSAGGMSTMSGRSKKSKSIRTLTISAPLQKQYDYRDFDEEASTPLTPRIYNPPPPPLPPTNQRPITPIRDSDDTDDIDIIETYGYEGLAEPHPLPRSAPHRAATQQSQAQLPSGSAGASAGNLPLRSYSPANSGARQPVPRGPASPGAIKTTVLEPRRHPAGWAPLGTGRTPLTAGLASPYSPYMPSTPMTPVTPHLVNRAERRQQQREEGRRVATVEEQVPDDKEVWGGL